MDAFPLIEESSYHAENQETVPGGVSLRTEQIVALARPGRSVESLAREFEPCMATIRGWAKQAGLDVGDRSDRLTRAGRDELRALRKDRDILSKGEPLKAPLVQAQWRTPGLHGATSRPGLRIHDRAPCRVSDRDNGDEAGCVAQRLTYVVRTTSIGPLDGRWLSGRTYREGPCRIKADLPGTARSR